MNEIIIQVHADRKLSKKVVDIGNMQESGVTKLIFELDEGIVALGGNVYLITSYDGESHPHALKDNSLEIDRSFTQRKKTETNIVVSTSNNTENPLDGVVWISNTLILTVDKNNINIDSINEEELPPSLKIIYDDLLNLQKDLQEKKDSDYWRGSQGPKGDAGSVKFVVVKELPTENIEENVMYLLQVESEEENNKFLEYIYFEGAWECVGTTTVEVDLSEYVKNTDYASRDIAGVTKVNPNFGVTINNGTLAIVQAINTEIDAKANGVKPITPNKLDYAVKKALSNCKLTGDDAWTDEEKAKALETLGVVISGIAKGSTIPIRNVDGTIYVATPVTGSHATTKKYVDDLIANVGNDIESVCIVNNAVKSYMDNVDYSDDADYIRTDVKTYSGNGSFYNMSKPMPALIKWKPEEHAVVQVVSVSNINNSVLVYELGNFEVPCSESKFALYNLLPNKTYYYKVSAIMSDGTEKILKKSSFTTTSDALRMIHIDGIKNVRDLGGWRTSNGKTVKYGLVYRGAEFDDTGNLNSITDRGADVVRNQLKIKADIDLRSAVSTTSPIGGTLQYFHCGIAPYESGLTLSQANIVKTFKTIASFVPSKAVYFHCQGGRDRTGTIAFLLLGLLGVSESDLSKDYELTEFATPTVSSTLPAGTNRTLDLFKGMVAYIKTFEGNTLQDKIYTYLTSIGLTEDIIVSLQTHMID